MKRPNNIESKPLKVFISYKWEDQAHNRWVEKFATDLRSAGINALLDRWEVRLGESFTDYMTSQIKDADVVLFIMTTRSVKAVEGSSGEGGAVKFEMQMSTSRRVAGENFRLIGIYREGSQTAAHIRDHRYADFRDDALYETNLRELVDDLLHVEKRPPLRKRKGALPKYRPFDPKKIAAWDWSGVDIRKESQGNGNETDSIIFRVIRELQKGDYQVIFDDDGGGEAADIVTIRIPGKSGRSKTIEVEFYHCKYSNMSHPGLRLNELYEVCGQAMKSALWMKTRAKQADLFSHLLHREARIVGKQWPGRKWVTRFERGHRDDLLMILNRLRTDPIRFKFKVFIVLPGLSRKTVNSAVLELLSATENHLMSTCNSSLGVIASP